MLILNLMAGSFLPPLILILFWIFNLKVHEKTVRRVLLFAGLWVLTSQGALLWEHWQTGASSLFEVPKLLELGNYQFDLSLRVDRLGLIYGLLTSVLYLVVLRYSFSYLSREQGYMRFFILISTLSASLILVAFAANYDLLAIGWEMIGVCSVLLIGFFHRHERGARSSLVALISYKFGDAALLTAIGLMHHLGGSTDFATVNRSETQELILPALLMFAALPKAAQFPFSAWIKRAVEGPSTSTAIFYGALSIHLGPFLLLRTQPLWENHWGLRIGLVICSLVTILIGTAQAKTQSDAKSVLVAASQVQVALIMIEIILGFSTFGIFHLVGHAGLRTWQILRASSLLQDFQDNPAIFEWMAKTHRVTISKRGYHYFLNGFYIEATLEKLCILPFRFLSRLNDSVPRALLLAILGVILSLLTLRDDPRYLWVGLLVVLWESLRALATHSIPYAIFLVSLSQLMQIWLGLVYTRASPSLVIYSFMIEVPLILALFYWIQRINSEVKLTRQREFYGLNGVRPELFPMMIALILLIAGLPIGITYFTEELIFHELLSISATATGLLILAIGLNVTTLLKVVYRLFWGMPEEGLNLRPLTKMESWSTRTLLFFYAISALMAQPLYEGLHHFLTWL